MTDVTQQFEPPRRSRKREAGVKLRDADKLELIPVKLEQTEYLRKPDWIRVRLGGSSEVERIKKFCAHAISSLYAKRRAVPILVSVLVVEPQRL